MGKALEPWSPEYLTVLSEIDASYFELERMMKRSDNRAPLMQMIDKATGFDEHQLEEAKAIVDRIKELQSKLPPDDPHFKDTSKHI